MTNQRTANTIRQDLEDEEFDTGRYAYDIDVETLPAVPNYVEDIQKLLNEGIVIHDTENSKPFEKWCSTITSMSRTSDPQADSDTSTQQPNPTCQTESRSRCFSRSITSQTSSGAVSPSNEIDSYRYAPSPSRSW